MRLPDAPAYRRLLTATVISQLGDWSSRIALAVLIFDQTGDERWVGVLAAMFVAPWLGLGQLLTSWSERFDRQRVMVIGDLIRAAAFAVIAVADLAAGGLVAIVFLAAMVDPVFEANASALVYGSLEPDDRDDGLQFKQVVNQLAQVVAVGGAGIAVAVMSPQTVVFVNAASFAISAAIVASTRTTAQARGESEESGSLREAFIAVVRNPHIRPALLTTMLTVFSAQAIEAQIAVLAGTPQASWVLPVAAACIPATTAIGAATAPTSGGTAHVLRRSLVLTTIATIAAIVVLQVGGAVGAVGAAICAGLMFQTTTSGQVVAFRHFPDKGKAATINIAQTLVFLAIALAALVSGIAMASLGRERGLQLCLILALTAWLVPMPSDPGTTPAADEGDDERADADTTG